VVDFLEGLWASILFQVDNFPKMGLIDVIDIVIVSYIFYLFLIWIKETRAWSLIRGIILVYIIKEVFKFLSFKTLSYIIEAIFDIGLIVAIVLFQPEIRRALEQIGKGKFITSDTGDEYELLNRELLSAIKKLSAEFTGALICVEQNIPLRDYALTGIAVDSVVTSQLLCNIFVDKTPLHDGAVIISKNRIYAAACILPVTSQEIDKGLGTRHRAAVGISEVSDCVTVVVSEETGKISVAVGGKLYRKLSISEVEAMLPSGKADEKSSFFSILRRILK
jgi:diadenylate cyclase